MYASSQFPNGHTCHEFFKYPILPRNQANPQSLNGHASHERSCFGFWLYFFFFSVLRNQPSCSAVIPPTIIDIKGKNRNQSLFLWLSTSLLQRPIYSQSGEYPGEKQGGKPRSNRHRNQTACLEMGKQISLRASFHLKRLWQL